ncbi:Multidrug resistance-associated protein 1 [Boothiomyces macroporosus]|uniref:Multidrug resistance-associated protein 1 n=1 Tax=Boothiomyces macroporosus TaxID=261099 RepID=A0AAD5YBC0_9FUNG|nr:Multidrug resistance-associated protein 1 [Boothiomyces macroporosus]
MEKVKRVEITPLNFLTIEWITPLMFLGARKPLEQSDLYDLAEANQADHLSRLLDPFWKDVQAKIKPSLIKTVAKHYGTRAVVGLTLQLLSVGCLLTFPTFVEQILLFLQPGYPHQDLYIHSGIGISFVIALLQLGKTLFEKTCQQIFYSIQVDIKAILIGAVYEKSLRLSRSSSNKYTQGKILNLINVDSEKISKSVAQFPQLAASPVTIVVSLILLGFRISYTVLGGTAMLIIILMLQSRVVQYIGKYQKQFLGYGDKRLKAVRELLYGIKIIKYRALENYFNERIGKIRDSQLQVLKSFNLLQVLFMGMVEIAPISMPITAFLIYSATNGDISPQTIFPALLLFNNLAKPMMVIPQVFNSLMMAKVSWIRLEEFLCAEEYQEIKIMQTESDMDNHIEIKSGCFQWEKLNLPVNGRREQPKIIGIVPKDESQVTVAPELKDGFKLDNISISVKKGAKVAIVGPVGAGKSSLLSAIIGEMPKLAGDVSIGGRLAYCSQQPWILTDTIEGNIVFNSELDQDRLDAILEATGLDKDMKQFPAGAKTGIGEKGVNLSGGQKARVSLARAMYQDADIVILDDPISALDAQVGRKVFTDALKRYMHDKTVILVTHQLHFLPEVDHIIVLDNGKIAEQGSFKELMASGKSLSEMMQNYAIDHEDESKTEKKVKEDSDGKKEDKAEIIVAEDQERGVINFDVYFHYFENAGGMKFIISVAVTGVLSAISQVINNLWLSWWTSNKFKLDQNSYMWIYGALGIGQFLTLIVLISTLIIGSYVACKVYHKKALTSLLRAPMGFFDSQPVGRILNRMSKDIESMDQEIWIMIYLVVLSLTSLASSIGLLIYVDYRLLAIIVPLVILFYFMIIYFQRSNREFKRFESTNRSPLYSHVSETMAGIATVKAYGVERQFIEKERRLINESNIPTFLRLFASTWIAMRMEMLTSLMTLMLCLLGTVFGNDPSLIGLALTYTVTFAGLLSLLLMASTQLENAFNSVERLSVYCEKLPMEGAVKKETDPSLEQWPSVGSIEFRNIVMAYPSRPDLPVLKDISFGIKAGEKVGIIGRTGSGKSSLMTALFRIVELSSGSIVIDGVDISSIGLDALRKSIQIIPQEPVLFTGTIRDNLDVEALYSDPEIWEILGLIGLKDYVSSLTERLDSPVAENGENLSVGQRQLICLGRAILLKPRILIMDEATASVDAEADKLIQASLKSHFANTTVLSIAHRLNTIADFDRVLVLEYGEKKEYDTPHALLSNPSSLFSQLAGATGATNAAGPSAIIGEMPKLAGDVSIGGRLAYCSQQPWILTDTIEGNIVFNSELDQDRLDAILEATGLDKDMKQFPAGAKTGIGEKGVNLSGGQKARVSLARAMYQDADIVILDDPISALDAQVGRKVFTDALKRYMHDKTVILVTHQLHFLPEVDHIIVLDNGKIAEQGSFKELMASGKSLSEMMQNYAIDHEDESKTEKKVKEDSDGKKEDKAEIIVAEDQERGVINFDVYFHYFENAGGMKFIISVAVTGVLSAISQVINNLWLSWWTSNKFKLDQNSYMWIYGALGIGQFLTLIVLISTLIIGSYVACKVYHKKALTSLLRAPMGFFDSQPVGRILNRMSKDIESMDQEIWIMIYLVVLSLTSLASSIGLLIYVDYRLLAIIVPLVILFYFMIIYFQRSNREFKRFESTNRSPLYSHVSETMAGIATVKAYGVERQFIEKERRLINESNIPTFLRLFASTWIAMRMEMLTSLMTLMLCLLGTVFGNDPSLIGLALTYTVTFAGLLSLLLMASTQLENAFNSVERLSVYCEKLPMEGAVKKETDPSLEQWPSVGSIEFRNIVMAYPSRPDLPVLKDISFGIKAGEKVGIIGRTGSGKSSLMTALFRIVELSSGSIVIDGVDISSIGLDALRKSIQIIPQEPVLFTGTIRDNLDVEALYSDPEIWEILGLIGLKDYVSSLTERLDSPVAENGENLSVGQRQLICLGRAILLKPRILIMDEATASVDAEADKLIQASLKSHFANTTVLSIAHRLNTIADFDRVLVLEYGEKKEYDTPHALLSNPSSLFSQLAGATGATNAALLRDIAKDKHNTK